MSQAGAQAWAFYREVAASRRLWTVRDDAGYPAPKTSSGVRAMPFWSSLARAERIIKNVPAYAAFRPDEVSWERFCAYWVPELAGAGELVGLNWSGPRARGFDLAPDRVRQCVQALIDNPEAGEAE